MVKILRLKRAVENIAWRDGAVQGDGGKHHVQADGTHVLTIVVPATLVDPDSVPKPIERTGKMTLGPSTPDTLKGGGQ